MDRRLELQALLASMAKAYFQPPSTVQIEYPCFIYHQDDEDTLFAGNRPYRRQKRYQVTFIAREPDSPIPDQVAELPLCSFDRAYVADNLNHTVFTIYF